MAASSEHMVIAKQIQLSPGHRVMPHKISLAANGDLIVLGSTDNVMDYRAWATRLRPDGEARWDFLEGGQDGWNDHSISGQRFYGAIDLPNQATLLCGIKKVSSRSTVVLVMLDASGKLLSEKLLPPVRDTGGVSLYSCHKQKDGFVLMGTVGGQPAGTGWMTKLDWNLNAKWSKFSPSYGNGEYLEQGDALTALGWYLNEYYVVKIGPDGDITAKHLLPAGDNHLVQGYATESPVRVISTDSRTEQTRIFDFDGQLQGPTHTLDIDKVKVNKALAMSDGTLALFGSTNPDSATAAVTRVYQDGRHLSFRLEPLRQSPWFIDAILTGRGNEMAAVRQVGLEQGILEFISFN